MVKYTQLKDSSSRTISIESNTSNTIHSRENETVNDVLSSSILIDDGEIEDIRVELTPDAVHIYNEWLEYLTDIKFTHMDKLQDTFDEQFALVYPILFQSAQNKYNAGGRLILDVQSLGTAPTNYAGKKYLLKYK
mgnify:FL=1